VIGRVYIRRESIGAVTLTRESKGGKSVRGRVIESPKLPAPMRGGAFSAGVEAPAGRTVYVSGQVAMDAAGNVVGEGDVVAQTEKVLENLAAVLEEAGGGLEDVVKVTVFITDMGMYEGVHGVRRRPFSEPYPASSMVEVSALIDPRLLVEVEAVAVLG
jgi:2-iminobutanoate/2-iminopropanoate deaminase